MKGQLKSKHIHYIHSVYRYCVSWLRAWRCFRLCPDWCNLKGRRTLCTQLFNLSHGFVCSIFIQQGNVVSGGVWGLLKVQTDWGPHTQTEASPSHSPSLAVICLSHLSVSLLSLCRSWRSEAVLLGRLSRCLSSSLPVRASPSPWCRPRLPFPW